MRTFGIDVWLSEADHARRDVEKGVALTSGKVVAKAATLGMLETGLVQSERTMRIQPSDIVTLLGQAARKHEVPTLDALRVMAERGEPILDVCHEAIRILANEKALYRDRALTLLARLPLGDILPQIDADKSDASDDRKDGA